MEAGIVLTGTEVKSLRAGKATIGESWVGIDDGEVYLKQANIAPYSHGNYFNHPETRPRKLLLHTREIKLLVDALEQKGLAIVPLSIYLKGQLVKVEIAVGRGKKLHDKRHSVKSRDAERQIERALRHRQR
jgi:SsrA-binding protein